MMSREYLSFTKRERTGIITLVILLIIMAVMPKFFCNPKPVAEKLPEKQLQQLADRKTNYYTGKRYRERDTVYVIKNNYYPKPKYGGGYNNRQYEGGYGNRKYEGGYGNRKYEGGYGNRKYEGGYRNGVPANPLRRRGGRGDTLMHKSHYAPRPGWVRPKATPIDINTADTSAFITLPGIGSKLANRIVSFRSKLGGFNSVDQIREVYGLRDSVFQIIQPLLICQLSP